MMTSQAEKRVPLKALRNMLPTKPTQRTLEKWCNTGIKNRRTGQIVVMFSKMEGGRRYASIADYDRFCDKVGAGEC